TGVEFKRDDVHPQSLAKEIASLANLEGGYILIGVEDDGTVTELIHPDIEEGVMNICLMTSTRHSFPILRLFYGKVIKRLE
ncbi:ATP-dependent DNA helicase RecG, partial [Candidatus Hakubella thermalkaliphila]